MVFYHILHLSLQHNASRTRWCFLPLISPGLSIDDFAERMYGYPGIDHQNIEILAVDAFLRGCSNKLAALMTAGQRCTMLHRAVRRTKENINDQKAIGKPILSVQQVRFTESPQVLSREVDFVIEPLDSVKGLLMGAGMVQGGHHAQATFLNDSSRFVTFKTGISCGTAVELDCVAEDPENDWIPCQSC